MSCCNFSGADNSGYNLDPETERITEAIYSDWTEAAGHPDKPLSPVPDIGRSGIPLVKYPPADIIGRRANGIDRYENEFGRVAAEGCQTDQDCPEGQRCNRGRCEITTRMRMGGPRIPGRPDFGFDGGAVKQNWVPLVVLGLSLVVGIAISEYGFKKIVK